jgi:predicted AAA+ superfamily ATPase
MKTKYIERDIKELFFRHIKSFPVTAVTGARQTGKTTFIKRALKDYDFISLDESKARLSAVNDPQMFLNKLGKHAIIDEIQYAPGLLPYIKMRVDSDRNARGAFVLTGSQQFLMMKGLTESLAGRIGIMNMYPFSVLETEEHSIKTQPVFTKYSTLGSFPEPLTASDVDIELWYNNYINTYVEKDVKSLYNIGNAADFHTFLQLLAFRTGRILNLSTIASETGVSVPTVKSWLSVLQASNIIYLLMPYHANIKKRLVKSPKLYFYDTALACRQLGIRNEKQLLDGPFLGAMFENFCVIEAVKALSNRGINHELHFIRTNMGLELDLLVRKDMFFYQFEIKASRSLKDNAGRSMIACREKILPKNSVQKSMIVCLNDGLSPLYNGVEYGGIGEMLDVVLKKPHIPG